MIEVRRLVKRFGSRAALRNLDFRAAEGEFVAILGPNGAGKTTFLRILATLSKPAAGEIRLAGFSLPRQAGEVRACVGFVSHQPLLYGDLSGRENLEFYARLYRLPGAGQRVREVLELVGLEARAGDLVRTYSRGMQQRLSIGRAILHDPKILLLDEPHTGLDQDACAMLDDLLRRVSGERRTVVMATHDLARAQDLAGRFDILSRGKICASYRQGEFPADQLLALYRSALVGGEEVRK